MPEISKRYVAEIDMPEGIVSIDCDVSGNRIFLITLQLNNSSLSFNDAVLSPFLEGLVLLFDHVRTDGLGHAVRSD